MIIKRASTTYTAINLNNVTYGRGSLLPAIRNAKYTGAAITVRKTTLIELLSQSGQPARSEITLRTTKMAATISGHFKIPFRVLDAITPNLTTCRVGSYVFFVPHLSPRCRRCQLTAVGAGLY